jgi:YD repeat-containing protein
MITAKPFDYGDSAPNQPRLRAAFCGPEGPLRESASSSSAFRPSPPSTDSLSRRLTANDPDLGAWTYEYDDAGRLTLQTDALGQKARLTGACPRA